MRGKPTLAERIWAKFERTPDGCWTWTAAIDPQTGYGRIWVPTGTRKGYMGNAHRVLYELVAGPVGGGLELDHLCRNRACVNPLHMEPVTHAVNVARGERGALRASCPQGHPLTGEVGSRRCQICRKEQTRAAYIKRRDERRAHWAALGLGDAA